MACRKLARLCRVHRNGLTFQLFPPYGHDRLSFVFVSLETEDRAGNPIYGLWPGIGFRRANHEIKGTEPPFLVVRGGRPAGAIQKLGYPIVLCDLDRLGPMTVEGMRTMIEQINSGEIELS